MAYRAPLAEMRACAAALGAGRLAETTRFAEIGPDTADAVLDAAAAVAERVLAPLNRVGDAAPARLENGVVRAPPGFAAAHRALAEGGWIAPAAPPAYGGLGLPQILQTQVNEMMSGACLALSTAPLLAQGQIEALAAHGSDPLKAELIPELVAGRLTATMNLSEPQAGSDVGAVALRAAPMEDGRFALTGEKIWITWGAHDMTEAISHLVLARLPGAPPGTAGISLFAVPSAIGGAANGVRVLRLEEKLGLHGSPTCALAYEGAVGRLVGAPGRGLAAMFTMMNAARLAVGVEGVGIAEAATQRALVYALERRQGRTTDGSPSIAGHTDVRRTLLTMRALTLAARGLAYDCALSLDLALAAEAPERRVAEAARAAALTPIVKAFGTETGAQVADLGIQVHGGVGYVEETGAAQLWRDGRVTAIYEGTNGIQAADLVGRKLTGDRGTALLALVAEIGAEARTLAAAGEGAMAVRLARVAETAERTTRWMLAAPERADRDAGATPYLRMLALSLGGRAMARLAAAEPALRPVAAFYLAQILPRAEADAAAATEGAAPLFALPAEALA